MAQKSSSGSSKTNNMSPEARKAKKKAAAERQKERARKEREAKKIDSMIEKEARREEKEQNRTGKAGRVISRTPLKLAVYAVILILLLVFAYLSYDFGKAVFSEEGVDPSPGYTQTVVIEPGMSALDIGELLEDQALIDSRWVFLVQSYIFELSITDDTAGTYKFNSSYSGEDIIKMINNLEKADDE